MFTSKITGTGSYLPKKILSNADLEKIVDTNNKWIIERTGISQRRIASPEENTTDLAAKAALQAIKASSLQPSNIDFILFATTSPDKIMPNAASILQTKIGAKHCAALDIYAACTGFLYGYALADQMIQSGAYKNILVVGAEILSRYVDYTDRRTCILFGDGAGAAIISRSDSKNSKVYSHKLCSNGEHGELLTIQGGGSQNPASQKTIDKKLHFIKMEGQEIFKLAIRTMTKTSSETLKKANLSANDVNWLIPHQANLRIIELVAKKFNFPMEKVLIEINKMGNNSSATIPICLDTAIRDKRIIRGHNLLLTAFGGGLTSGSLLLRY